MKKNLPLILAIAIPVAMILFVAGSIYLPKLFFKPTVNFLYVVNDGYAGESRYYVVGDQLFNRQSVADRRKTEAVLYIYDVATNQSRRVSYQETQNLKLDPNRISPDGFEIVSGNNTDAPFPFGDSAWRDYNVWYIIGHGARWELTVRGRDFGGYQNAFRFLGWITQ